MDSLAQLELWISRIQWQCDLILKDPKLSSFRGPFRGAEMAPSISFNPPPLLHTCNTLLIVRKLQKTFLSQNMLHPNAEISINSE